MRSWIGMGIFTAGLLISTACQAQTIQPVGGNVLVSKGRGYFGSMAASVATLANRDGQSRCGARCIRFPDGCRGISNRVRFSPSAPVRPVNRGNTRRFHPGR